MKLKHIDNSFYHLTANQALSLIKKQAHSAKRLPRHGYETTIDPSTLSGVTLSTGVNPTEARSARVKRTPLSWFNGKPVSQGYVWALHLYFSPKF